MVFGVPICRAEQRRIDGGLRPSAVRIPQQLTLCVSCQVEFRDRLILLSNAREPQAVMAGCPLLWLLSEGQASESDSPRGEKSRRNNERILQYSSKSYFLNNLQFHLNPHTQIHCLYIFSQCPNRNPIHASVCNCSHRT